MAGRSRYDGAGTAKVETDDGAGGVREVTYLLTRTPVDPDTVTAIAWHRVVPGDRLDLIAARHLGDATAWWQVCDANLALDPDGLTGPDAEGSVLTVPTPGL